MHEDDARPLHKSDPVKRDTPLVIGALGRIRTPDPLIRSLAAANGHPIVIATISPCIVHRPIRAFWTAQDRSHRLTVGAMHTT